MVQHSQTGSMFSILFIKYNEKMDPVKFGCIVPLVC